MDLAAPDDAVERQRGEGQGLHHLIIERTQLGHVLAGTATTPTTTTLVIVGMITAAAAAMITRPLAPRLCLDRLLG